MINSEEILSDSNCLNDLNDSRILESCNAGEESFFPLLMERFSGVIFRSIRPLFGDQSNALETLEEFFTDLFVDMKNGVLKIKNTDILLNTAYEYAQDRASFRKGEGISPKQTYILDLLNNFAPRKRLIAEYAVVQGLSIEQIAFRLDLPIMDVARLTQEVTTKIKDLAKFLERPAHDKPKIDARPIRERSFDKYKGSKPKPQYDRQRSSKHPERRRRDYDKRSDRF